MIKKHYDLSIESETKIEIKQVIIYPVRGIQGITLAECTLTQFGLEHDRQWVAINKSKLKPISNHNNHLITRLK